VRRGLVVALVLWSGAARSGGGPATDAWDGIRGDGTEAHAMLDLYLQHRLGGDGPIELRAFDPTNGPALGLARVTLAHRPRRFGFRIDAGVGDLAEAYYADDPLSTTHPDLARWLSRVQQAFVSARISGRVELDVGKFSTPIGLEDNEALPNWNYSRSLLFTWAEPSVHSGARATWELPRGFAVSGFWLNGWNSNFVGGNSMRSFAVAARWQPHTVELVLVYSGGLERIPSRLADPTLSFRSLIDFYVRWRPLERLTLALTADYGHDAALGGADFGGLSAYATVAATRWLRASVRGEAFFDPTGLATGTPQTLGEATLTLELHGKLRALQLSLRVEYRHDQSTATPFAGRSSQDTLTCALIAAL
jgi:hypothetical protein